MDLLKGIHKRRLTAHLINSKERTNDVLPDEIANFSSLLLSTCVFEGLKEAGFERPSPIQLKAIPLGKCGIDLIAQAKSGTGKTCVFAVIALEAIKTTSKCTQVIVLAPTREIAVQIRDVICEIGCKIVDLECHVFIGGTSLNENISRLKKCHIAVGTPGRIKSLIEGQHLATEAVRLFVLDEADKLLEEGSLQEQINWIYSTLPEHKQVLALSATYPETLATHLINYMNEPVHVRINVHDLTLKGVQQFYKIVPFHHLPHVVFEKKAEVLAQFLGRTTFQQCLVFSNYQTRSEHLSDMLTSQGWPATFIAGKQSQTERLVAMKQLKQFKCRVLISTDLTSRGIDCENVDLVVNLDLPWETETYLHRIGRAGRFGGYATALSLVADGNELKKLKTISKEIGYNIRLLSADDMNLCENETIDRAAVVANGTDDLNSVSTLSSAETVNQITANGELPVTMSRKDIYSTAINIGKTIEEEKGDVFDNSLNREQGLLSETSTHKPCNNSSPDCESVVQNEKQVTTNASINTNNKESIGYESKSRLARENESIDLRHDVPLIEQNLNMKSKHSSIQLENDLQNLSIEKSFMENFDTVSQSCHETVSLYFESMENNHNFDGQLIASCERRETGLYSDSMDQISVTAENADIREITSQGETSEKDPVSTNLLKESNRIIDTSSTSNENTAPGSCTFIWNSLNVEERKDIPAQYSPEEFEILVTNFIQEQFDKVISNSYGAKEIVCCNDSSSLENNGNNDSWDMLENDTRKTYLKSLPEKENREVKGFYQVTESNLKDDQVEFDKYLKPDIPPEMYLKPDIHFDTGSSESESEDDTEESVSREVKGFYQVTEPNLKDDQVEFDKYLKPDIPLEMYLKPDIPLDIGSSESESEDDTEESVSGNESTDTDSSEDKESQDLNKLARQAKQTEEETISEKETENEIGNESVSNDGSRKISVHGETFGVNQSLTNVAKKTSFQCEDCSEHYSDFHFPLNCRWDAYPSHRDHQIIIDKRQSKFTEALSLAYEQQSRYFQSYLRQYRTARLEARYNAFPNIW